MCQKDYTVIYFEYYFERLLKLKYIWNIFFADVQFLTLGIIYRLNMRPRSILKPGDPPKQGTQLQLQSTVIFFNDLHHFVVKVGPIFWSVYRLQI